MRTGRDSFIRRVVARVKVRKWIPRGALVIPLPPFSKGEMKITEPENPAKQIVLFDIDKTHSAAVASA